MSKSSVALVAGRVRKKSSRKAVANRLVGGAAVACVVIGCGYTVYSNIIAASVYPTLGTAGYDEPVVRQPQVATRSIAQRFSEVFASLPEQAPAAISATMFNERFAASAPESVPSNAASAAPPPEAPKLAEAPKTVPAPKLAEAKPADAPKAEAVKAKPAPQQLALNVPPRRGPRRLPPSQASPCATWPSAPRPR